MRKSLALLFCLGLCLTVAFFFTQLGQSEAEFLAHGDDGIVDDTYCMASGCHVLGSFGAGDGSLHGSHSNCAACHEGGVGAAGNVFADTCIVCHPAGDPGLCPLSDVHGTSCIGCHTECAQVTTTTTTMPAGDSHGDNGIVNDTYCMASGCHVLGSFGAGDGSLHGSHSNCAACHEGGVGAAGNVFADTCIVCHPAGDPGLCPLSDVHGTSCIGCHTECAQVTTTTTSVPVTGDIEVSPERIFRSRWIVIPAVLAIRGTGAEFDRRTSKPSYSPDNALIPLPPLQLGPELIVQSVLVKPEWWALAGNQTVTVTVDGSSADFDIELLPFILDK